MNLEVYRYKSVKPAVESYFKNNPNIGVEEACSTLAAATHVPVLAICYFVEELQGPSQELESLKNRIRIFYRYDKVIVNADNS